MNRTPGKVGTERGGPGGSNALMPETDVVPVAGGAVVKVLLSEMSRARC